jgi:hypothetical protein
MRKLLDTEQDVQRGQLHLTARAWALLVALPLLLPGGPARAQKITRGPYLQAVGDGEITVVWDQNTASAAEVRYGPGATSLTQVVKSSSALHHEVKLTGLQPGQTYHYAVTKGSAKLSSTLTFPSAVKPSTPFRFIVFGDTRSDHVAHQKQINAMAAVNDVRLFINTGDLVADGGLQTDWDTFFQVEQPLMGQVPLFPVVGNHDEDGGKISLYKQHFVVKGAPAGLEAYYAFTYGNARFIVLDSHVNVDPWYICALAGKLYDACFKPAQLGWLKQQLTSASTAAGIQHIFVLLHMGPYSSKDGRTGYAQLRELLPLLKTHGVRAVISGHDHYYERGVSGNGIPYIITGGGGAGLYTVGKPSPQPHTVITNTSVHHHCIFDIKGPQVSVTVKALTGKTIDQFVLGSPAPDGGPPPVDAGPTADQAGPSPDAPPADSAPADSAAAADGPTATPDTGASASPDAPAGEPPPDPGGCCRLGGAASPGRGPLQALLVLVVVLLLRRRTH